jgi:hypothetical protein
MRQTFLRAAGAMAGVLGSAVADDPTNWDFDIQTTGNNVSWTSPTSVDPNADLYEVTATTTLLEVGMRYLFFNFTMDLADQIPPEFLVLSGQADGPAPIVIANKSILFPAPPAPVTFAGTLSLSLDASGTAHLSLTDVVLGTAQITLPGFGLQTVTITQVRFVGEAVVKPLSTFLPGDTNCDGSVSVGDIGPFVMALTDPAGYEAAFPECSLATADMNQDGQVSVGDIGAFVAALTGG